MLYRVLILLGQDLTGSDGPERANILEKTMEPFGVEYHKPAVATIMATILLSSYLLQHQPSGTAGQFRQPSLITPLIVLVQDLLGKSCWLSRHHSETLINDPKY